MSHLKEKANTILFLWILFRAFHTVSSSNWPLKWRSIAKGDIYLGGFFPVHARDNEEICGKLKDEGFYELEAMLYTVDKINNDTTLLPDIKLGVIAVDSCDSSAHSLTEALDFAKGFFARNHVSTNFGYTEPFSCEAISPFDRVAAIIGDHSSWVSLQIASVMKIYKVPQVSYQSTTPSLSNYEYFFRTVPPLIPSVRAILKVLSHFNWTYVAVVYADSLYGNTGFEYLRRFAKDSQLCFSFIQKINVENSNGNDYDRFILELLNRNSPAVVVFGDPELAYNLMSAATRRRRADKDLIWIGSTAWVNRNFVVEGNEAALEGAIGITHEQKPFKGFNDYVTSRNVESHREINPWAEEFLEQHLKCRVKNSTETKFNANYNEPCSMNATLPCSCFLLVTPTLQFVRDAVYSVAQALHNMLDAECNNKSIDCFMNITMNGELLKSYMEKVEFEDENGRSFSFDHKHAAPYRYNVVNFQRKGENDYQWVSIGMYYEEDSESNLALNASIMRFKQHIRDFPKSSCSDPCMEGEVMVNENKCCWFCANCTDYQYIENSTKCQNCSKGMLPNSNKTACEPIPIEYMELSNPWAVGCEVFSVAGILLVIFISAVIKKFWNTPVIMISGREFNCILLTGLLLSFSLTFIIVSAPSNTSCGIVRFFLGLCFTISYATIIAKILLVSKLVKKQESKEKFKYIDTKPLVIMILALICIKGIITAIWFLHSPPAIDYEYPSIKEKVLICKGDNSVEFLTGLVFPLFLLAFCTIYTLKNGTLLDRFKESRYINYTNFSALLMWTVFIPMYRINSQSLLRVILLSLFLNLSSLVQIIYLFLPKVYIALLRPEKNKSLMNFDSQELVDEKKKNKEKEEI